MAPPPAVRRTTTNEVDQHAPGSTSSIVVGKRKRRPAGTPDPDAEVVSLSAETLLESERYVCDICNQGFQRDQNLQMHRRRHKVPWKLVKREPAAEVSRKRVYVCPEPSCLHHDPRHALGDLVGIKKHFRRKHSNHRQWVCGRCSKAYAVQSDYKAHLKTCGTRGHSCDCGRVFSRVESFIEHQDACNGSRALAESACLLRRTTLSCSCPSGGNAFHRGSASSMFPPPLPSDLRLPTHNLELQLLPTTSSDPLGKFSSLPAPRPSASTDVVINGGGGDDSGTLELQLSIGLGTSSHILEEGITCKATPPAEKEKGNHHRQQQQQASAEKVAADEARRTSRRQMEMAQEEFSNARRIRQMAQTELSRATLVRDQATKQIDAIMLQVTCNACKKQLGAKPEGWA